MKRGDTLIFDVQVFKLPPYECVPEDITGWTFWFTAKEHFAVPDATASIRLGTALPLTGVALLSVGEGKVRITVPAFATSNFPDTPETLVYDVQGKDLLGNIRTVEDGTLEVRPDVTRAIA